MDIEHMKMVVDLVTKISGDSKEAFIWWLVVSYGPKYLFGLVWSGVAIMVIRKTHKLIIGSMAGEKLRHAAKVSICWSEEELQRACNTLKRHYHSTKSDD